MPDSKTISVETCCRKLLRRSAMQLHASSPVMRRSETFGFSQIMKSEIDELRCDRFPESCRASRASSAPFRSARPSARRAARVGAARAAAAGIEKKMQCTALELANLAMVEIAKDVARNVPYDQAHDHIVDSTVACAPPATDCVAQLGCRRRRPERWKIDDASRRESLWKRVLACLEIVLDESLSRHTAARSARRSRPRCSCS